MNQNRSIEASLVALHAEMNEANQKCRVATAQLENALDLKKASQSLETKEIELLKEARLSREEEARLARHIEQEARLAPKLDSLIAKSKKILFRTNDWGCVTVISKRKAATYAHKEHSTLVVGQFIQIYSVEPTVEYRVKVLKVDPEADGVILESDLDLCDEEPQIGVSVDGRGYFQLGLSARSRHDSPLSISKGIITSNRLNRRGQMLGSGGSNPGDSGGPCFDESTGELIGMNVGCENIAIHMDIDTGTQIYHKFTSRYAARSL